MKKEDVKIGMKVQVHSKSTGIELGLSSVILEAKRKGQKFLYVTHQHAIEKGGERFMLSDDEHDINLCGDYFLCSDFEPYNEEN